MLAALPPVFAGLSPNDSAEATHYLQQIDVPPDEAIMIEGESDQTLAFVVKGACEVWMGQTKIGRAGPREMLGELELFYPMERVCSVTAANKVTLQILTPEALADLAERGNPIVYNIERAAIRHMSDRLGKLNSEIAGRAEGHEFTVDTGGQSLLGRLSGAFRAKAQFPVVEPLEVLLRSEMFSSFPQALVADLADYFEVRNYDEESVICEQGSDADEMFVLAAGEVEVALMTDEDNAEVVGRLKPGHAFGDAGLALKSTRTARCVARGKVVALVLSHAHFTELHVREDAVGSTFRQGVIRNLAMQLIATSRRYVALQGSFGPETIGANDSDIWR